MTPDSIPVLLITASSRSAVATGIQPEWFL